MQLTQRLATQRFSVRQRGQLAFRPSILKGHSCRHSFKAEARGGFGSRPSAGNDNNNRLIIPGASDLSGPRQQPKLIIPGQEFGGGQPGKPAGPPKPQDYSAPTNNFRPPPGFMNLDPADLKKEVRDPQDMLNQLRARAGHWHQLAKLLPDLLTAGYDAPAVEEHTGLEKTLQNIWQTSVQVYESIKASGVSDEVLAHYDGDGAEHLLYDMRFIPVARRPAAAVYMAEQQLDAKDARVLCRAIKEHERRRGTKEGFSDSPGDCWAFKFYRDAQECRKPGDKEACVTKGLQKATTPSARAALASLALREKEDLALMDAPQAAILMTRMTPEECSWRPIALVGSLDEASPDDIAKAPASASSSPFGAFRPSGGQDQQWLVLTIPPPIEGLL